MILVHVEHTHRVAGLLATQYHFCIKSRTQYVVYTGSEIKYIALSKAQGHKSFACSTHDHLNIKCILLTNVEMPTVVGILTFINRCEYNH